MRNPFRHFCKSRGIPDYTIHPNSNNQQNNASVLAPSPTSQPSVPVGYPTQNSPHQQTSAPEFAPPLTSQSLVPVAYPTDSGGYDGNNEHPHAFEPLTAYPAQQGEEEAEWEINAGNNINKKGLQKTGHIIVGNTSNGAILPVNLPRNGRFVFNAGGNTNEGASQEAGSIEFANVR